MEFLKIDEDGMIVQVNGREPSEEECELIGESGCQLIRYHGNSFQFYDPELEGWCAAEIVE